MPHPKIARLKAGEPAVSDYIDTFTQLGYKFALNECSDRVEVNGKLLDDVTLRIIRARARAEGYTNGQAVEDAMHAAAHNCRYHPIRNYLHGLTWDGKPHITNLASYFVDVYGMFPVWLRKWLIGSVKKAVEGTQNFMLVMDGPQGIGKSMFVKWLCPLPDYYDESQLNPDDKDCRIKQASVWIWEVSELGATIRRADVEALKQFITKKVVYERNAYGHYPIHKPTLSNFVGTVNNDSGILVDRTGNRRFIISKITKIDWPGYCEKIDVHQVWAEANDAYLHGEANDLSESEKLAADEINENYKVPDSIEAFLYRYYDIEPKNQALWTSTADIIMKLQEGGFKGNSTHLAMGIASIMNSAGVIKKKQNNVWGYYGVSENLFASMISTSAQKANP